MNKIINSLSQTIFALSTIFGRSAVSIIRISGRDAFKCLKEFGITKELKSRYCYFLPIKINNEIIDNCLIIVFQNPKSFTGEDLVELQLHGSKAIISEVLNYLSRIENYRMAEHGEFTRRAFLNGKLDLVQAEGLLSVIHSETKEQLRQANNEYLGKSSEIFQGIRQNILEIFANCEALMDFPEDDIGESIEIIILQKLKEIKSQISEYLDDNRIGEKIKDGFKIAIVGEPNVGKSSLMNYLAKKPIAIVSDIPGTTRDLVRVSLDISGYAVELIDTAGIRETEDKIESIGVNLAKNIIFEADLILILVTKDNIDSYENLIENFDEKKHVLIMNKVDLEKEENWDENQKDLDNLEKDFIKISVKNERNLDNIIEVIKSKIENLASTNSSVITSQRQRFALTKVYEGLIQMIENFDNYQFIDILTEDIRTLVNHMNELIGDVTNDDILDELFFNFCIGK
jgi:tRNA modification GTPase